MNKITDQRPWGNFEQFTDNEVSTVKILNVKPNSKLSYQYHHHREEFWRVLDGNGIIVINEKEYDAKKYSEFIIKKKDRHRIITKHSSLRILEISFGKFDEKDIIRIKDDYGRVE